MSNENKLNIVTSLHTESRSTNEPLSMTLYIHMRCGHLNGPPVNQKCLTKLVDNGC